MGCLFKGVPIVKIRQLSIRLRLTERQSNIMVLIEVVLNRIQQYTAEGTKGVISINQNTFPIVIHTDLQNGSL